MKKLSDYKGEEAFELWADLLEPLTTVLSDKEVQEAVTHGKSAMKIAKEILKSHKAEASEILLRIDPEPLDGLNVFIRLVTLLVDIGSNDEVKSFFGFAEQAKTGSESSGVVTESIKAEKK